MAKFTVLPKEKFDEIYNRASDDCISRKAALDIAFKYCPDDDGTCSESGSDMRNMLDEIEALPPAETPMQELLEVPANRDYWKPRCIARWIPIGMADAVGGESAMWGDEMAYHACNNCWQQALERDGEEVLSDFCPNCGAEMEVDDGHDQ